MSEVATEHDVRHHFGPARDQGPRPTCLAFAISDTHAALRGNGDALSCEFLYYHAIRRDGSDPASGATVTATLAAVEHDGQPLETGWPYLAKTPDPKNWRPPGDVGQVFTRSGGVVGTSFDDAWALVQAGRPAVIAITFSDAFYVPKAGIVDAVEPVDPVRRHAVVAVAAGRSKSARFLMVRNSWGPDWGDGGHAWLAEQYLGGRVVKVLAMKEGN